MDKHTSVESALRVLDGVTHENYFADSATPAEPVWGPWSKSALKRLVHDTDDWMAGTPFKATDKMRFGSLVDDYLFWGDKFRSTYAETSDCPWNKNPGRAEAAAIRARKMTPVKPAEMDRVRQIEQALLCHPDGRDMLAGSNQVPALGAAQIDYTIKDVQKRIYVPVKGLLDSLFVDQRTGKIVIYDMKVTSARNLADIWSIFTGLCYHWQDHLYTQIMKANGYEVDEFRFVFVQDEAPFRVQTVVIDNNMRAAAENGLSAAWSMVAALGEGITTDDMQPEVATFGTTNPFQRFVSPAEALQETITLNDVIIRGKQ